MKDQHHAHAAEPKAQALTPLMIHTLLHGAALVPDIFVLASIVSRVLAGSRKEKRGHTQQFGHGGASSTCPSEEISRRPLRLWDE